MEKKTQESKEPVKEEIKERLIVVTELPKQDIRKVELEDGSTAMLMTIPEALVELIERIRRIDKTL